MESKAEKLIRGFAALNRATHLGNQSDAEAVDGNKSQALKLMIQADAELDKAEEYLHQSRE